MVDHYFVAFVALSSLPFSEHPELIFNSYRFSSWNRLSFSQFGFFLGAMWKLLLLLKNRRLHHCIVQRAVWCAAECANPSIVISMRSVFRYFHDDLLENMQLNVFIAFNIVVQAFYLSVFRSCVHTIFVVRFWMVGILAARFRHGQILIINKVTREKAASAIL